MDRHSLNSARSPALVGGTSVHALLFIAELSGETFEIII